MPTSFSVISLGVLPDIDTQEGNNTAENAGALVGMTFGGPGTSTQTIAYYLWEQVWQFNKFSFGAAASILLLIIFSVLIFTGIWLLTRQSAALKRERMQ